MKNKTLILLLLIAFCTNSCKKAYNKMFKTKIDVTVTDGNTGLPVKGAIVKIWGYNALKDKFSPGKDITFVNYRGVTNEKGKFYYEFKADLESSLKYEYMFTVKIYFPDSSNYKTSEYLSSPKKLQLGHKNIYKVIFYK